MASLASLPAAGVVAYAPASIGNVAAGFDLLGAALAPLDGALLGDLVHLAPAAQDSFRMQGPHAGALAGDGRPNLVLRARDLFAAALAERGVALPPLAITLEKRLPVSSGLGSSASSIVAAIAGLQALCGDPFEIPELVDLAGRAEGSTSGSVHLDNVVPSLLGGLQLVVPGRGGKAATRRLPWPSDLLLAVVHPDVHLPTALSRKALPERPPWSETIEFAGNLAGLVHALHTRDRSLVGRCLRDPIVEGYRAPLVPAFRAAQAAALEAGALGCSLSGSGPSIFAVVPDEDTAAVAIHGIREAFGHDGVASRAWVCALDPEGARILPPEACPSLFEVRP